jgi:hypothetical protein
MRNWARASNSGVWCVAGRGGGEWLSEAIRLEPDNPRAYEIRAEAHEFLGDTEAAEADRRKVAELPGEELGDSRHGGED